MVDIGCNLTLYSSKHSSCCLVEQ